MATDSNYKSDLQIEQGTRMVPSFPDAEHPKKDPSLSRRQPRKQAPPTGDLTKCGGCGQTFPSRNAVFRHLKETNGVCLLENLSEQEKEVQYKEFEEHVRRTDKLQKVLLLYGYLPFSVAAAESDDGMLSIRNGQDAGRILMEAVQELQDEMDGVKSTQTQQQNNPSSFDRLNRSYGNISKVDDCIRQDPDTAAISEVMAVRLRPLRMGMTEDEWLDLVQKRLDQKYLPVLKQKQTIEKYNYVLGVTPVRILGRLALPNPNFNAETDVTQRRIEYLLPVDFLVWSMENGSKQSLSSVDNEYTTPAAVSSSVTPSHSTTASSPRAKTVEGWDLPPPIAVPSSESKCGWKSPQLQWKTPQRIASLSPIALPAASKSTKELSAAAAAVFDETNGAGRLFCAPHIVSKGRYVLVASGATLFLYQVTSSLQEPLESLPLPARTTAPISKLTLTVEDPRSDRRDGVASKRDSENTKLVGDIQQLIFHEESSILYLLTVDCCVFQVVLQHLLADSTDSTTQIDPPNNSVSQSTLTKTTEKTSADVSGAPSLTVWRKFQTTEFGANCMTTLNNGGGKGLDVLCVGYNSGIIECWLVSQQQPEMMRSLHESRRPQQREKSSILRWKGYMEHSVRTLTFARRIKSKEKLDKTHQEFPATERKEDSAPKSNAAIPDSLAVSEFCLIVVMQTDPGSAEYDDKHLPCSIVEILDSKKIFEQRIEFPRREVISLQNFVVPTPPGMELSDTRTLPLSDHSPFKRSPLLGRNAADAATVLSTQEDQNPIVGMTLSDGTVAIFSCIPVSDFGNVVGVHKDYHQIALPYPAVGSGVVHLDAVGRQECRSFLACCLRGGTCYLVPTDGNASTGSVTAIPYPHDVSSDHYQVFVQSFTAGNLHTGTDEKTTPVVVYALPGGIVDIYTCELLFPKSNFDDVVHLESTQSGNFGAKIRKDLPVFLENHKHDINHIDEAAPLPEEDIRLYMTELKNIMKLLRTHIVAVDLDKKASVWEKRNSVQKRKQQKTRRFKKNAKRPNPGTDLDDVFTHKDIVGDGNSPPEECKLQTLPPSERESHASTLLASVPFSSNEVEQHQYYLKRKRFHNFTSNVMAHQYLAYRRLDRLYHRATLELPSGTNDTSAHGSKFAVISMSGDMFLTGQAQRVIGVFLALVNGVIDKEFVECVFDEDYPHLVSTPPAPPIGVISAEAHYMNTEGKIKSVLSPRVSNQYDRGFNQTSTLIRVKKWQEHVYHHVAYVWEGDGRESPRGRLKLEKIWTDTMLIPWAERARKQLDEYRLWKKSQSNMVEEKNADEVPLQDLNASIFPSISTVDLSVPEIFEEVLQCLRKVDASGEWPSTTPKRQLVMVSTQDGKNGDGEHTDSLAIAHSKAKRNVTVRSSAYSFTEGQGGASGSFSVGYMPGGTNKQPKANSLFPKLVKAAFQLEVKLCPDREPSSTIAINRNAQFRPHTDSGAGAGQSTSLIVGLGTYSGGELVVEGTKHNIRYKAIEFNGWKQRHWTLPFKGERYSLVWFTPKGCEGMKGVDLDL